MGHQQISALRIIPAYAGSTKSCRSTGTRATDHPRIRGEHDTAMLLVLGYWGSSPHTRGARLRVGNSVGARRIIPAYAGSTSMLLGCKCGQRGSSPHTRGAPLRVARHCDGTGLSRV